MNVSQMLSFGAGGATVGAAVTTNDNSQRRPLVDSATSLARRSPNLQQQQDEAATAFDQLQDDLVQIGAGGISTTTIATTSTILISTDVTQAFDNSQNSHWMINSPNRSMATSSTASELISGAISQQQHHHHHHHQQQEQQQSFSDWWQEYWSRQPFPSGYTQSSITLVACLLTTIIFLIVVGNLLVCIAIFTEKSLKPTQNWFIASLAVSDMLLGLVVMPFSLARELMGFWIFGPLWCDIHEALDVLLTTASINTLCLISLDRYWSITQAVSYLKKRTPRRAVFMIAFVWVFSAAVSLPPLFGWKKQSPLVSSPAVSSNSTRSQQQQHQQKQPDSSPDQSKQPRPLETSETQGQEKDLTKKRAENEEGGGTSALTSQAQQQWQRKRRRHRRDKGDQLNDNPKRRVQQSRPSQLPPPSLMPSSSSPLIPSLDGQLAAATDGRQFKRDNLNEFSESFQQTATDFHQQQTVINYAYLSGEPQPQLEQQQANEYPTCQLSDDVGYVLYSALGSFFIPCAVMVFTYIKIGLAARKRARRAINKQTRGHQTGSGGGKRGAAGGLQRRTIAGTTSCRASNQHPVGDSALLLTSSLATGVVVGERETPAENHPDQILLAQKRLQGAHHHHRNSRASHHTGGKPDGPGDRRHSSTPTPLVVGKLVVVERQKVSLSPGSNLQQQQQQEMQTIAITGLAANESQMSTATVDTVSPVSPEVNSEQDSACCSAMLITSGSKLASPSALKCSSSCGGVAAAMTPEHEHQKTEPEQHNHQPATVTQKQPGQQQDRKPTSESNDSSLITVMSASMNELPQVTRFNFTPKQSATADQKGGEVDVANQTATSTSAMQEQEEEKQRTAALLRAISRAGRELADDKSIAAGEIAKGHNDHDSQQANSSESIADTAKAEATTTRQRDIGDGGKQQQQSNNQSTNETCFMTIEEDSDNLDAQTGRTIMMIASTAKQSSCSLASKSQVGMMMTMMPAGAGGQQNDSSKSIVCNNVACLRRQARRQANRQGSSYCGSSMTINDEEEDEDEEDEDEEDEDEEDEDEVMANGDSVDEGDVDDDECLDDDLLTDDCNGYSGSCRLDAYCPGTASSTCTHCRECAALSGKAAAPGECIQDSPLSCAYNYSKYTPQDSPQLHGSGSDQAQNKRSRRFDCHHHHSSSGQHQDRAGCNISETEAQSLTGDDNLSLTDYYRSNEDNSSFVGHDVLDATPASDHLGPKRKSIVATALASVGGGINRMTSGAIAAGSQQQQQQHQTDQAGSADSKKKIPIGFHLARFGSGDGGLSGSNLSPAGGGLLALAAASQQQHQTGGNTTRNLKTLRQNFFHKLNQLTAKSATKHDTGKSRSPADAKSSVHSSYGSSYEPSVDCATTSNMHSTNDQYQVEATFGETDDYEQQTSAETTKQSSDQLSSGGVGGRQSPAGKLMSIAQQATAAVSTTGKRTSSHPVISSKDVQPRMLPNQRSQAHTTSNSVDIDNNNNNNKRTRLINVADEESSVMPQSASQISLATEAEKNIQSLNVNERQMTARISRDSNQKTLISGSITIASSGAERRSNDKSATMAIVCSSQASVSDQRVTRTNATFRQGVGASSGGTNVISKAFLASDNERHKRKLAKARERRATLILGLIMATFICCWFPFFTFYVLRAICHVCRDYIPPRLEAFIFWMGYCNSAINPIIYTIFNRDFRKAFRKILFRCSRE